MLFGLVTLGIGLACATAVLGGFTATAIKDEYRFWPPGDDDEKLRAYLICSRTALVTFLLTCVLDFGSAPLPWPATPVVGGALTAVSLAVLGRSARDLGEDETKGRTGQLRTDGLYRYTRHPQNVGYVFFFGGVALLASSTLAAVFAVAMIVWLVVQVYVEEPWLHEQYEGYAEYCRQTPRFVGIRSVRAALRSHRSE